MSDFSVLNVQYNTGTDSSPTWTGTALAFGGSGGANELRFASPGGGATTTTTSASWPYMTRPPSGTSAVTQMWAFPTDGSGSQINTYDGTSSHYKQLRFNWDNLGTFAAQPQFSWFGDSTLTTPSAGDQSVQPATISGAPIVNGHATDTSSTSYMKMNAYGRGTAASGSVQDTPSANAAGTLAVTSGTAGAVSPPVTPAWLATWQSAQGWTSYILDAVTPQATFAGNWYFVLVLYAGVNESTGTMLPVLTFQYSFS